MEIQQVGGLARKALGFEIGDEPCPINDVPATVDRYVLLRLIKRVGREMGFNLALIQHLEHLVNHTRDCDWEAGSRPIVYKTVKKTAHDLGISERQVNNRERALSKLKVLTWAGLGNYRRTGTRDKRGRIVFAYGVDLSPLVGLYDELKAREAYLLEYEAAWERERRRLSSLKRQVRERFIEAEYLNLDVSEQIKSLDDIPRVRAATRVENLQSMIEQAAAIRAELDSLINGALSQKTSDTSETDFRHNYYTSKPLSSKEDTCNRAVDERAASDEAEVSSVDRASARMDDDKEKQCVKIQDENKKSDDLPDTGIQHIKLGIALEASTERFRGYLNPAGRAIQWADLVDAADWLCGDLGINRHAWIDACAVMGRYAAALSVLIIDRRLDCPDNPVRSAGGALRGMTRKAEENELHLHRSVFGILDRDHGSVS